MVDLIEKGLDIAVHHPLKPLVSKQDHAPDGLVHGAAPPVSKAAILEFSFEYGRDDQRHGRLEHAVAHGRDRKGPGVAPLPRQPGPKQGKSAIRPGPDLLPQASQISV